MRFITLTSTILLALTVQTLVLSTDMLAKGKLPVPLLLASSEQNLSPVLTDFFQALHTSLADDPDWYPAARQPVLDQLGLQPSTLPLIDPVSVQDHNDSALAKVQSLLDAFALPGAIIANCQLSSEIPKLKSCSIAFYDSTEAKITARARKEFKSPVNDASLWAPKLLYRLRAGLLAKEESKLQAKLRSVLHRDDEVRPPMSLYVQATGFGEQSGSNLGIATVAGLGLTLGLQSNFKTMGLSYERAEASGNGSQTSSSTFTRQSLGAAFGVASPALNALIWDLTLVGGYSERHATFSTTKVSKNQIYLGVQPGMLWQFSDVIASGLTFSYRHYLGGQTHRQGYLAKMGNQIMRIGLTVQAKL